MWSVDPQAYEAHKKAEKRGDNKKHKNVSSTVCVAATLFLFFFFLSHATCVGWYLIFIRPQAAPSPPGKLVSCALNGRASLVQPQCGVCVQLVETGVKETMHFASTVESPRLTVAKYN